MADLHGENSIEHRRRQKNVLWTYLHSSNSIRGLRPLLFYSITNIRMHGYASPEQSLRIKILVARYGNLVSLFYGNFADRFSLPNVHTNRVLSSGDVLVDRWNSLRDKIADVGLHLA